MIANRLFDLPVESLIVVGYDPENDRPKGADRFVYQEAQKLGFYLETHPAKWEEHGKSAGFIRNAEMVSLGADLCLVFWNGKSAGTKHTMDLARKAGIPVEEVSL